MNSVNMKRGLRNANVRPLEATEASWSNSCCLLLHWAHGTPMAWFWLPVSSAKRPLPICVPRPALCAAGDDTARKAGDGSLKKLLAEAGVAV